MPADSKRNRSIFREEAEFALFVEEPLVLLGYRFGGTKPWEAVQFTWNDRPREEQTPPLDSNDRALLAIRLGPGGESPARNLTLSLDFTRALNDAVRELARCLNDPRGEARTLATLRRRFPDVQAMLSHAVARTAGMP